MSSIKTGGLTAALVGLMSHLAFSQAWTTAYTSATATGDCKGLSAGLNTDFSVTPVVSKALFGSVAPYRVMKMAFFLQPGATNTDIYMVEKGIPGENARILWYNGAGATPALTVIGTLTNGNYGGGGVEEQGLVGIALNQKSFATDNFLYLYYTTGAGAAGSATVGFHITRVTVNATTKVIDFSTEKTLIHIPAGTTGRWHTGGGMAFDNDGNLYISVSDNESLAMGPGNTADLRGNILRIHPDAADPKGYTIPKDNFGEYWAAQFTSQGKTGLAAKYSDQTKVKPEIYIKGMRNVYSYSIDKTRPGMVEYSQCGPDAQRGETHALTTKPAFGGWPFWVYLNGAAVRQSAKASAYDEAGEPSATDWATFNPASMSTNTPVNNWSGNKGVDTLPPYHFPFYSHSSSCAAGGPIIRYDGGITNPGQMPPQLDNTVMFGDYSVSSGTNSIWAMKLDPATGVVSGTATYVFTMARPSRPSLLNSVDFQQGPDGALYLVDFGAPCCSASPPAANGGISRISYTGNCKDPGLHPVTSTPRLMHHEAVSWFQVKSGRLFLNDDANSLIQKGSHTIKIMDVNGKVLYTFAGHGVASYALPSLSPGQLYVLRAETPLGIAQRTFSPL
jgi:glucose/arabinose dehydrogenase